MKTRPDLSQFDFGIHVRDLTITERNNPRPLVDIDKLDIEQGEVVAFKGKIGAGKSLAATALLGTVMHAKKLNYSGDITYDIKPNTSNNGAFIPDINLDNALEHFMGFVAQKEEIEGNWTVLKNLMVVPNAKGITEPHPMLDEFVTTFDLADKLSTKAKKLSGGWQQLVAIASAFATGPRAVVLDEATSSLDQGLKERVPEFFNYIAQEYGTTIVMVTHDVDNIVAPRIIEMDQGKIVSDIVRNPKHR